jgi:hypothetical protein
MNYIEIILKLNKLKKILFLIFLVFLLSGHLLQKYNNKNYQFTFDIFFPTGTFLIFSAKNEIYKNFKNSILTEFVKKGYNIKKKQNLESAYNISTSLEGNNNQDLDIKIKEVTDLFLKQKENLISLIRNNYDITNITLKELPVVDKLFDTGADSSRSLKLELMWIELEQEYVTSNISVDNNITFPDQLARLNSLNYYAFMIVLYIALLTLYVSFLIIAEDFKKNRKKYK